MKHKSLIFVLVFVCILLITPGCQIGERFHQDPALISAKSRGDIVVSPNGPKDGGDFGPHTPGTKTSGLQEAFDYAKESGRDLYIAGRSMIWNKRAPAVYPLSETLHIPWMQDFRCDSGQSVIQFNCPTGDAVVIDSQMSCHYRFGLIVSNSPGAVVRFKPKTNGPDNFKVITTSEFYFSALVGGGGAWPGGKPNTNEINPEHSWISTGLLLDAAEGSINDNKISLVEIVGCDRGIYLSSNTSNNWIDCPFIHLCKTHIQVGDFNVPYSSSNNRINAFIHSQGIENSIGAVIHGSGNIMNLSFGHISNNNAVILDKTAANNIVFAANMQAGYTNKADSPTNRIILADSSQLNVQTPEVPQSNTPVTNQYPCTISILIKDPGSVNKWSILSGQNISETINAGLTTGQMIILAPGQAISLDYNDIAPAWKWFALN